MTKNTKIILFTIIGIGILALVIYGVQASQKLDNQKETSVASNIDDFIYDEAKEALKLEEEDKEEDLDGEDAVVEDDDFEVYEEDGGWEEETTEPEEISQATTKKPRKKIADDELEELYDNRVDTEEEVVKEEKLSPPEEKEKEVVEKPMAEGKFLVVVGSFKSKRNANKKLKALEKEGFQGTVNQLEGSKLQTVIAGRFPTNAEAEALMKKIKDSGLRAIVKEE